MKPRSLLVGLALTLATLSVLAGGVSLRFDHGPIAEGGIYPGTTRSIEVWVPDAYDPSRPACLYVGLDGELCHAKAVIDSLISVGRMPVTIAVFVQPGVIKDDTGNVLRYNRSNEFDATTPAFARFLETEILPAVERLTTPDGRRISLSRRGADHAIFGLSSGGIAAFTAAWTRPDLFARVFSGVGTFVAMRGGNDLQALVRKSEPRPIRVFLQDGTADVWNPTFGHWYEGNRMLASALDFAGYDARYDWGDGGHNVHRATEIFADVMEWLWHDYPEPPAAGTTGNELLARLLAGSGEWQNIDPYIPVTPNPDRHSAVNADSTLAVATIAGSNYLSQSIRSRNGDQLLCTQPFYCLHSLDNTAIDAGPMVFDSDGNLWVATPLGIQICDQNGRVRAIVSLPDDPEATNRTAGVATLALVEGAVLVVDTRGNTWRRALNVAPARPGVRPASQGQG